VVHVQHSDERQLYALERLWRDCPRISLDGIESAPLEGDEGGPTPGLLAGERPGR
jgi:ribosome-associated protein